MENPIAQVFIGEVNDDRNKCLMFEQGLRVVYKGKPHYFDLESIQRIRFYKKKLMAPYIIGSIIAPLTLVAIFKGFLDPWLMISLFVAALFAVYYGWVGGYSLTVELPKHNTDFLLNKVSVNLKSFVDFFNAYARDSKGLAKSKERFLYHLIAEEQWVKEDRESDFVPATFEKDGFIHTSTFAQLKESYLGHFKNEKNILVLVIDPVLIKSEIKYEYVKMREDLLPHIFGSIPQDAITEVRKFSLDQNGKVILSPYR